MRCHGQWILVRTQFAHSVNTAVLDARDFADPVSHTGNLGEDHQVSVGALERVILDPRRDTQQFAVTNQAATAVAL